MDRDIAIAFEGIRDLIGKGHARLEAKLDMANDQFNKHLREDGIAFTRLEMGQDAIIKSAAQTEMRRKEESDKRFKKVEAEQTRKDQWKIAKLGGWFLLVATLLGILGTGVMNHIELRNSKDDRAKVIKALDAIQK